MTPAPSCHENFVELPASASKMAAPRPSRKYGCAIASCAGVENRKLPRILWIARSGLATSLPSPDLMTMLVGWYWYSASTSND